jgi:acyl carrier protein
MSDDHQQFLADSFAKHLGSPAISIDDNLFELGVDSAIFMAVVSHTRETYGVEIPIDVIFEDPTVRCIAKRLGALMQPSGTQPKSASATVDTDVL